MPEADLLSKEFDSPQAALAHYGVKGMRWGVRKEDEPVKEINVKKAERHEKTAARAQKAIDDTLANPSKWKFVQAQNENFIREMEQLRDQNLKDAEDVRAGRLTDGQKAARIGLAVTGGLLAAYGTYKFVDSGQYNQAKVNLNEKFTGQEFKFRKKFALRDAKGEDEIYDRVVKGVNPGFGGIGTKMNCRRCTFAYEMRRRGYDVQATKSSGATGQTVAGVMNATNPNSKLKTGRFGIVYEVSKEGGSGPLTDVINRGQIWGKDVIGGGVIFASKGPRDKSNAIFDAIRKNPDGARGELGVGWTMGGGHSMAWEVIGGKPVIFDCQTGHRYNSPESFEKFAQNVTDAATTRLDNVTMNEEFLKRWLRNAD